MWHSITIFLLSDFGSAALEFFFLLVHIFKKLRFFRSKRLDYDSYCKARRQREIKTHMFLFFSIEKGISTRWVSEMGRSNRIVQDIKLPWEWFGCSWKWEIGTPCSVSPQRLYLSSVATVLTHLLSILWIWPIPGRWRPVDPKGVCPPSSKKGDFCDPA